MTLSSNQELVEWQVMAREKYSFQNKKHNRISPIHLRQYIQQVLFQFHLSRVLFQWERRNKHFYLNKFKMPQNNRFLNHHMMNPMMMPLQNMPL